MHAFIYFSAKPAGESYLHPEQICLASLCLAMAKSRNMQWFSEAQLHKSNAQRIHSSRMRTPASHPG